MSTKDTFDANDPWNAMYRAYRQGEYVNAMFNAGALLAWLNAGGHPPIDASSDHAKIISQAIADSAALRLGARDDD